MLNLLWLVLAFPLAGAVVLLAGARRFTHRTTAAVGVGATGLSLLVALGVLASYAGRHGEVVTQTLYRWIAAGDFSVEVAFRLDPLSAVMLFFVTFVGFLIHVYSTGYMHDEPPTAFARYFAYLNLFMFAMLTLVLGANLLVLFVGWEGVGLCSYLLIGFYFEKDWCAAAGKKAFVVNRIGDFGFLLAIFMAFKAFGTVDMAGLQAAMAADPAAAARWATPIALLLFVGAVGKSAQLPLYVWLPDAMAGPTPVSALIHAATMVTAGVYMVARTSFVYALSPTALLVVAVVGGLTAVFAATIGLAQNDIKKVLAYSTVSQLGYMFMGAGAGAFTAAIFHVFTHAFFKACLFLGSGSVIHACGGEQDMRKMGGLRHHMKATYWTFLVATLALAGIPVFAGFFSKDEILAKVFAAGAGNLHGYGKVYLVLWGLGVAGAFLTAFYMFRAVYMTFFGSFRGGPEAEHHLHESPGVMVWPLRILAAGSVVVGFVGIGFFGPRFNLFERFLHPVAPGVEVEGWHAGPALEVGLIALSVGVAVAGILLARRFYFGPDAGAIPARLATAWPRLYRTVANKYWVDEGYDAAIVRPTNRLAWWLWKGLDTVVIDGVLVSLAFFTEIAGDLLRFVQTGNVRNYALMVLGGAVAAAAWLLL
ncbi:MAG TPA: NADH-quinone oxidoreductase subunit L [Thermoanaerobaculaceae bacterium]|nr:NADH-quinone oxidoreductase subunit L [Thermoanaerobaculaceae bacterium]HRS17064.1 NADH-quinone oxidoreductase subunit L [Thermoanaerobaculaceae bacterium]